MRFDYSQELEDYRAEVRAFIARHGPGARKHVGVRAPEPEQVPALRAWVARLYAAGYLGQTWPVEYGGRPGATIEHTFIVAEEIARARTWGEIGAGALAAGAILAFGSEQQRQRYLPRDPLGRGAVVPAVQRARRGQRPGQPEDPGGARRRRLRGQRAEGVDHQRPPRRSRLPAGAHQPRRRQAGRHHRVRPRHADAGRRRPAAARDHRDQRLQRGLPRQRAHPGRPGDRRGRQRLAGRQRQPRPRAQRRRGARGGTLRAARRPGRARAQHHHRGRTAGHRRRRHPAADRPAGRARARDRRDEQGRAVPDRQRHRGRRRRPARQGLLQRGQPGHDRVRGRPAGGRRPGRRRRPPGLRRRLVAGRVPVRPGLHDRGRGQRGAQDRGRRARARPSQGNSLPGTSDDLPGQAVRPALARRGGGPRRRGGRHHRVLQR